MELFLFVVTAYISILSTIVVLGWLTGDEIVLPVPIFHKFGITFGNTYVICVGYLYQIYYWAIHFNLI